LNRFLAKSPEVLCLQKLLPMVFVEQLDVEFRAVFARKLDKCLTSLQRQSKANDPDKRAQLRHVAEEMTDSISQRFRHYVAEYELEDADARLANQGVEASQSPWHARLTELQDQLRQKTEEKDRLCAELSERNKALTDDAVHTRSLELETVRQAAMVGAPQAAVLAVGARVRAKEGLKSFDGSQITQNVAGLVEDIDEYGDAEILFDEFGLATVVKDSFYLLEVVQAGITGAPEHCGKLREVLEAVQANLSVATSSLAQLEKKSMNLDKIDAQQSRLLLPIESMLCSRPIDEGSVSGEADKLLMEDIERNTQVRQRMQQQW
jgi:hypothetical protein